MHMRMRVQRDRRWTFLDPTCCLLTCAPQAQAPHRNRAAHAQSGAEAGGGQARRKYDANNTHPLLATCNGVPCVK